MEIGRGAIDEDGDGIFKLLALLEEESGLRARGSEQRFFLSDIEAGCDSAFVTGIYEIESFLMASTVRVQDADFGVELPKREIVAGKFRGDEQADVFKVGGVA